MLSEHGAKIAPSTFYEVKSRPPSRRQVRDAELVTLIEAERERQKFIRRFGARKTWLHLRGRGHDVARCTIERIYRQQGWVGALRQRRFKPHPSDGSPRPVDLVDREFWAARPNQLWVADFTYVPTWSGMVYVAFVFDVFSRRIVGWRAATRMTTDLVLDTLEHAIWTRQQAGITDLTGLVHHTDAGSQGGLNRWSQHLDREVERWVHPSGRNRFGSIEGTLRHQVGRRWRGVRTGSGSGLRSLAGSRPRTRVPRPACRDRSDSAGFVTLVG